MTEIIETNVAHWLIQPVVTILTNNCTSFWNDKHERSKWRLSETMDYLLRQAKYCNSLQSDKWLFTTIPLVNYMQSAERSFNQSSVIIVDSFDSYSDNIFTSTICVIPHWRVLLWRALVWRVSLWRFSFWRHSSSARFSLACFQFGAFLFGALPIFVPTYDDPVYANASFARTICAHVSFLRRSIFYASLARISFCAYVDRVCEYGVWI